MTFKLKPILFSSLLAISTSLTYAHSDEHHNLPEASQSGVQMTTSATALINNLTKEQQDTLVYRFIDDANRTYWTNAPVDSQARNGLPIGRLSIEQRVLLHKLLISSTSSQGYQKIWGAVRGDDELKWEGEERELDSEKFFNKNQSLGANNYWVSFYGDPRIEKNWGFMITGHHLAANFTVVDGQATFVPMFYGSDPAFISHGAQAGHVFLAQERNRGLELIQSFTEKQQSIAVISETIPMNKYGPTDFLGPGKKDKIIEKRGISADQLSDEQQILLWVLIKEYINNADFDVAEAQLEKIEDDGLSKIRFMWMGPTDGSEQIFFRVSSPSILIDFVDQRTGFDWNTHPHTIVRDPSNDYGENWLDRHIDESHTRGVRPIKE